MTFTGTYSFSDRGIFDLKILLEIIRFVISHFVLALIFLFLIIEEFEWVVFSNREGLSDKLVDQTSWNFNTLINKSC